MPIAINGSGTITGISAGGLPDGVITTDDIAASAITRAKMGYAGAILQVVQTTKTDTFSVASTSYTDITGLSASITPASSGSTILVIVDAKLSNSSADASMLKLLRNSTDIYIGDAAGSRIRASTSSGFTSNEINNTIAFCLDSPSTTSSITYKAQVRSQSGTAYLNRMSTDTDNGIFARTASSITLIEVAG
jgi:uncharacterized phosphosugar-binding protein